MLVTCKQRAAKAKTRTSLEKMSDRQPIRQCDDARETSTAVAGGSSSSSPQQQQQQQGSGCIHDLAMPTRTGLDKIARSTANQAVRQFIKLLLRPECKNAKNVVLLLGQK